MAAPHKRRTTLLLAATLITWTGCQDKARQAVTQPAAQPKTAEAEAEPPPPPATSRPAVEGRPGTRQTSPVESATIRPRQAPEPEPRTAKKPKRPRDTWVIFREAFEPKEDAACTVKWTGGNRLEVHTDNIRRITIDMRLLPEGAPEKGPWNLQIDGQGIEMTGFKPKPGYTGRIRDLVRSKNGDWTVDRKKLYRIRG